MSSFPQEVLIERYKEDMTQANSRALFLQIFFFFSESVFLCFHINQIKIKLKSNQIRIYYIPFILVPVHVSVPVPVPIPYSGFLLFQLNARPVKSNS